MSEAVMLEQPAEPAQLRLDGSEVPVVFPAPRFPELTGAQRAILRELAAKGSLRSVEAGIIQHTFAHGAGLRATLRRRYASADGLEAMKRLEARGFVQRDQAQPGRWVRV